MTKPYGRTVFLGGGRITAALLCGLRLARYGAPIVVHDRNAHKLRALKKEFRIQAEADLLRAVQGAGLLILAVRPAHVAYVLEEVRRRQPQAPSAKGETSVLACSLAAGIPLARLQKLAPQFLWARAMPSPVARSGNGLTAVAFARGFPRRGRTLVRDFFENFSTVVEVPESRFDAFTVTYSPSHGYHALAVLSAAGEKLGLSRQTAFTAAAHALADAIHAWREGEESLEALLHEAATPGGTAAAVMQAMDSAGYAQMVQRGLRAGVCRARANARLR